MSGILNPGQVVVVTGGARGIGYATALAVARQGGRPVIVDCSSQALEGAQVSMAEAGFKGDDVAFYSADVTKPDAPADVLRQVLSKFGRVDTLVNNAGITADKTARKMTADQFNRVVDINLKGVFWFSQCFGQHWADTNEAAGKDLRMARSVVTVSSIMGLVGNVGQVNYCATKWAVIGMMKTLALEWAKLPIRCNVVAPGFTATDMVAAMPPQALANMVEATPTGRLVDPESIANAILFLASPWMAKDVTGAVLTVDGGFTSR